MSKLVKCKACGHEVAKSAKVCPSCGKKLKMPFVTRLIILLVAFVIIGAIGSNKGGSSGSSLSSSSDSSKIPEIKTAKINESFIIGDFQCSIKKVEKLGQIYSSGVLLSEASDGAIYVAVEWSYKNISKEPKSSMWSPSVNLYSPTKIEYDQDSLASGMYAMAIGGGEKFMGDINPDITIKAASVFEVSKALLKDLGWRLEVDGVSIVID